MPCRSRLDTPRHELWGEDPAASRSAGRGPPGRGSNPRPETSKAGGCGQRSDRGNGEPRTPTDPLAPERGLSLLIYGGSDGAVKDWSPGTPSSLRPWTDAPEPDIREALRVLRGNDGAPARQATTDVHLCSRVAGRLIPAPWFGSARTMIPGTCIGAMPNGCLNTVISPGFPGVDRGLLMDVSTTGVDTGVLQGTPGDWIDGETRRGIKALPRTSCAIIQVARSWRSGSTPAGSFATSFSNAGWLAAVDAPGPGSRR